MKKVTIYLGILSAFLFISCEEETLEPRTNPRFSVTNVQEISSSGVQLGADIYDYGDEEILEYGFVYTQSSSAPDLNQDDHVSRQGHPEARFELVANHSMTLGKKYYVSAFLKTANSLVFSKSMEFISQGSEGFIINSIEWPELIYKDQKLLVKGRRFSKQRNNYKVKLGLFDLYPDLVDSNTFTINLPIGLLTQTTGQDIETELKIEINEKSYTEKRVLKFQEPVFESAPLQMINTDQEVVIKGDFLDLGIVSLKVGGIGIPGLAAMRNELRFSPFINTNLSTTQSNFDVTYTVRGKSYALGKVFALKGPQITVAQILLSNVSQVIPAVNLNYTTLNDNKFFDETGKQIGLPITKVDASGIFVNSQLGVYPGRRFSMQVRSFGLPSNFVTVEVANAIARIRASNRNFSYVKDYPAFVSNAKAYILTQQGIVEETLDGNYVQKKVLDLPAGSRWEYIKTSVGNGFIFGGGKAQFSNPPYYDLHFFSSENMKWERLPDLPILFDQNTIVTSKLGALIFEKQDLSNGVFTERWKLDLQSKVWEKLPSLDAGFRSFQSFYYNGEAMNYAIELSTGIKVIYRMRDDFTWEKFLETSSITHFSDFTAPVLLNGKYYIFSQNAGSLVEIDLQSKSIKVFGYSYADFSGVLPVAISDAIILLGNSQYHVDIRPGLF